MTNSDEYTWVTGHPRRKPSRQPTTFRIPCAFCDGTGTRPGTVMNDDCPSCDGTGWRDFEGARSDYRRCGRCRGSGRQLDIVSLNPCHVCDGSGIV